MLCDARTHKELHRRQIPSLRGKNLQWRSVFASDFVLPLVFIDAGARTRMGASSGCQKA